MALTRITVFLLKDVNAPRDAINAEKQVTESTTDPASGVAGAVFYQSSHVRPPSWVKEMNGILPEPIANVLSASASAVLVLQAANSWFAVSFGYGRSLIDPSKIERQFGLRSALNLVDASQLRSMSTKTFEDLVVSRSTQSSKSSELPAFGIDITKDILRGVAGTPRDKSIASRLHGADALTLVTRVDASELPTRCERLLRAFRAKDYKANFGWIDQLAVVDDPTRKAVLDEILVSSLRRRDTSTTYLAAPENIDWEDIEHFRIAPTRKKTYSDLDLDAYLAELDDTKLEELTLRDLTQRGVSVTYARSGNTDRLWDLYQCLISEQRVDGRLHVLIEGRWFEVEETLAQEVDAYLRSLDEGTTLTAAIPGEREPAYNERMALEQPNELLHLDARILRPGGAASGVEFCDLLSRDGSLIHVKRKSRSATLSHLFAQGSVAGRSLLADAEFREAVRDAIVKAAGDRDPAPWISAVFGQDGSVDSRRLRVSYVVLTKAGVGADWMPFFSKLNLMNHGKLLQTMSFSVAVTRMDN